MRIHGAATRRRLQAVVVGTVALAASATDAADPVLETVTVTATRLEQPAFDLPASIDAHGIADDALGVNLSESLSGITGLLARDRQNYAQDTQVSIRGFGARSTFGIRGLRVYLDGIPATQPDGQGQISHFNLATAERIEVLRGPFSALYGNSSGGVIQMFTAGGTPTPQVEASVSAGSYETWRASLGNRGTLGPVDYNFAYTRFRTQGFREHSAAERESLQIRTGVELGRAGRLTLLVNDFDSPEALDPLGLTREQFEQDPEQAAPQALQFGTRKSVSQTQGGVVYELDVAGGQSLRVLGYTGERSVWQMLAIPPGPQASPRHSGGVVDLGSDYAGTDARWSWRGRLAARPAWLVIGLSYDDLSQQRRGYENFVGETLGVQGTLRRDERNDVASFDQYAQAGWDFAERWSLHAGLRNSRIEFESDDRYVTDANGDDSGATDYSAVSPVLGLTFKPRAQLRLYGSYGRGFETPTFAELAYRPDGAPGLNFDLDAATSNHFELGAKWRLRPRVEAGLALFTTSTENELAVASNVGGRSTYRNIDRTRRQGAEAALDLRLHTLAALQLAYTWLDAEVRDAYDTCVGTPCTTPNATVAAGSAIPGVPQTLIDAELRLGRDTGWQASLDARHVADVPVNDLNSESAPSYTVAGLGGGYVLDTAHARLHGFLRIDNLFDEDFVGSVIVNDGNGRYYEPGAGRSVLAGLQLTWRP